MSATESSSSESPVQVTHRDVAGLPGALEVWTLARPERMNALSRETVRTLGRLCREVEAKPAVRAVIITGAGDKAFCAGADLKERQGMSEEDVRDFLSLYRVVFGAIDALRKPVIAAINGVAFGGGLEVALACDFRVMAAHAKVGLTETALGIIPGAGGTQRLTALVGVAKAKELILLAQRIDANRALELGVASAVAAEGESALEAAISYATPMVKGAPIAISAALRAIDGAGHLPLEAGLTLERACYEETLRSEDRLEALAAFQEKRAPQFKGR